MTTSQLRVGIVGCGGIARAHLAGYRHAGSVDIVSVYDVSRKAARQFAGECGTQVAASPEDMAQASLDAVSVCTPPAFHLQVCKPFLRAGIPILCEKPLEASLRSAARLQ